MLILNSNDKIENQPIVVRQIQKKTGQNSKDYYSIQVSFGLKSYDGKIWSGDPEVVRDITPGCVANIWGNVREFKGNLQIHINRIEKIDNPSEELLRELMPCCNNDEEGLFDEFVSLLGSIKNPFLTKLLNEIFDLPVISDNFFKKAAGAEIHHAYIGGLAQHTIEVAKIVDNFCSLFSYINRDIAICAALLHDVGKTLELSSFPENKYTDRGRLLGHIYLGVEILNQGISKVEDFPRELKTELEHCILSHHGNLETGSPVVPMTLEAIALHNADKASAEINGFYLAIERDTGTECWTDYNMIYKRCIKKTPSLG